MHTNTTKIKDEIQGEVNSNVDVRQSLDEISREVNEMKAKLTDTEPDPVSDGENNNNNNQQRAIIGEIEKIKKIAEILETVVLPTIVDSQVNAQKQNQIHQGNGAAITSSEPIKILPKGLKLLQHHSSITSNVDDGPQITIEKSVSQSDDK